MKTCPNCNRTYPDDSLKFCRVDGSELLAATSESETIRLPDVETDAPVTTSRLSLAPSIAVLPFVNMSADADNEYFCDGLAEEILNALTKIDSLKVAARTSAFSFKGKNENVSQIGNVLGVKTVLEGSVRKSGDRLRITVQLVNANDGYHVWSERYDREMKDVFDVQDEITLAVVDALKVKLLGEEKAVLLKRYTDSTEAYELYLKGRFHWQQLTPDGQQKGIEYFERALKIDPDYAPAYSGLADCYSSIGWIRFGLPHEHFAKARMAAKRALQIDDQLAEAYVSLGYVHFLYDWDLERGEQELRHAIEILPSYAPAYIRLAVLLCAMGRADEAMAAGRRAKELDPLALNALLTMGFSYYFARQYDRAIEDLLKVVEMHPTFQPASVALSWSLEAVGRYADAIGVLRRAREIQDYPLVAAQLAYVLAKDGQRNESSTILHELLEGKKYQYVSPYEIATVYMGLNDKDEALTWLERACEERSGWLIFWKAMPRYDELRSDARFADLAKRVGIGD